MTIKKIPQPKYPLTVILDRVRSAYNVGSVLRTSACAGIAEVITIGYTPDTKHYKVTKTSLGAEELMASRHFSDLKDAISSWRTENPNGDIYAFEILPESKSMWNAEFRLQPTAIILGNEVSGLEISEIIELGIKIVEIPMHGPKQSLNIANSASIAIYEVIRRWQ